MTRENIIALAVSCNILENLDLLDSNPWRNDTIQELTEFYHATIADFLKESGQYLTNDATREACIKQAKSEAFEAAAKLLDENAALCRAEGATQIILMANAAAIREMAKENGK